MVYIIFNENNIFSHKTLINCQNVPIIKPDTQGE